MGKYESRDRDRDYDRSRDKYIEKERYTLKEERASRLDRDHKSSRYGQYGVINLSDIFTRKLEFQSWFTEIKKRNLDEINNTNEKRFLEEFISKYNNCELPEKKYYDIPKWQAQENEKVLRRRMREKEKDKQNSNNLAKANAELEFDFMFDDEGQKEKEKRILKELEQKKKLEEAIFTMNKEKAEAMKEIDFKGNLMRHYYQTGDINAAKDLHKQYFEKKKDGTGQAENLPPLEDFENDEDH